MDIASFFWDPSREIFSIPYWNFPILWYSLLFAVGFLGAYFLFAFFLKRYFLQSALFAERDICSFSSLLELLRHPDGEMQKLVQNSFFSLLGPQKKKILLNTHGEEAHAKRILLLTLNRLFDDSELISVMQKDPLLKKLSCQSCYRNPIHAAMRIFFEKQFSASLHTLKKRVFAIAEKLFISMMLATIIGARLGHLVFYEHFSFYIHHPLLIFKTWEGGLASHGAALAILIALFSFCRWMKRRFSYSIDWRSLLDLMAIPTAFAAMCIRLGNFFNQEILGKSSSLPWAVVFGHPMDGGAPIARHPAQLYESIFYFFIFLFLTFLSRNPRFLLKKGKLIGLFLTCVFSFRFLIEFLKEEQSLLLKETSFLEMGQYLSLPFIILGLFLFFSRDSKQKYAESLFS